MANMKSILFHDRALNIKNLFTKVKQEKLCVDSDQH